MVIASKSSLSSQEAGGLNCINREPFLIVTFQENARAVRCPIQFRSEEQEFNRDEVKKLAEPGVIEKSQPPGRAQVVDLKSDNLEKQMCLECSTTGVGSLIQTLTLSRSLNIFCLNKLVEILIQRLEVRLPRISITGGRTYNCVRSALRIVVIYPAAVWGNKRGSSLSESS